MLRETSSDIVSFLEYPVHSNFQLILVNSGYFYFDLLLITQSEFIKADFSWNFRCAVKEPVLLLLSWSTLFSNFKIYSVLILIFLFWFPTVYPNCTYKSHLFFKFLRAPRKKQWYFAYFVEHPVYSSFKMYNVLILFFYFVLPLLTQSACV